MDALGLGHFDGLKGAVAVLPVGDDPQKEYEGQEYLLLYPYIDQAPADGTTTQYLWVNGLPTPKGYSSFKSWLSRAESDRA